MKNKRRLFFRILPIIFSISLLTVFPSYESASAKKGNPGNILGETDFVLTILHNNDGESQLINAGSGIEDFGGIARFATVVDDLRDDIKGKKKKNVVILLSSGDNFLAGPEFNASLDKGAPYFDSIALDKIGYDALAIGNHEFDFGPDVLQNFILGFDNMPPFVSANLDFTGEPGLQELVDNGIIVKSTTIKKKGETIGVVGATTPLLRSISSPRNVEVLQNVSELVQQQIDELQNMGIDKIILISHLQSVLEDIDLVSELKGVDVVIAGGGDECLADPGDLLVPGDCEDNDGNFDPFGPYPFMATDSEGKDIPLVTTMGNYKYVGRLIVSFDRNGEVLDINPQSGLVRVAGGNNPDAVQPDPEIQQMVVEPVKEFVQDLATNVIATSGVALNGIRGDIRTMETNEGNLIADALKFQATELAAAFGVPVPDVALQNAGGIRNDSVIPAGDITELDTFDMLPFSNFVSIVPDISRERFKEIMENAVSRVEFTDGRFAQISGFSMLWDPDAPVGFRVVDIILDDSTPIVLGGVVQPGDPVNIATIDFLARGGDEYPFGGAPFTSVGVTYQQALENYIVDELGGVISSADYPEGGEGRITEVP